MNKKLYRTLLILLCLVFLFCAWQLFSYFREGKKSQDRYEELAAMVEQARPTKTTAPATESTSDTSGAGIPDAIIETEPVSEYQVLFDYNPDFVGWIQIEDTVINYPVVQTPDRPEYYLHRDFDGEYNDRGCLFADALCDVDDSDNLIIYGHHMNDGSMFAGLLNYEQRSFWESHWKIRFDTLTEHRTYEIFAVFRTTASVGQGFPYHQFIHAENADDFDAYVADCKALSLYDTGIIPEYGDQLICLSTCEYTRENGRFVVMGVYRPQ